MSDSPNQFSDFSLFDHFLSSVQKGCLDEIKMLLNSGFILSYFRNCDPNGKDKFGRTPLHLASRLGNLSSHPDIINSVKFLLNKGLNVNIRDDFGRTPLHYAYGAPWEDGS